MGVRDGFQISTTALFNPVTPTSTPWNANPWDLILPSGTLTFTVNLPANPQPGIMVAVQMGPYVTGGPFQGSVLPAAGATINGQSQVTMGAGSQNFGGPFSAIFVATSPTTWITISQVGFDGPTSSPSLANGAQFGGPLVFFSSLFANSALKTGSGAYTTILSDFYVRHNGIAASWVLQHQDTFRILAIRTRDTQLTLTAATGTVNGKASYVQPKRTCAIYMFTGADWEIMASWGLSTTMDTFDSVVVSTTALTSGVAFQPSTIQDVEMYIPITAGIAAGSVTITFGPTTGAENTILSAGVLVATQDNLYRIRVPRSWRIVVTVDAGSTIGTATIQTC